MADLQLINRVGSSGSGGGGDVNLIEVGGASIALGQDNKAGSIPVVLPSDQDIATSAKQDTGNTSVASIDTKTIKVDTDHVAVTTALPAGTNLLGAVISPNQTGAIYSGTTAKTPQFASVNASSSGNNTIVAAGTGKIRVLSCFLVAAGAVTAKFQSGAGGTDLTGAASLAANGGYVLPFNPAGWFETGSATLLNLVLGGAVNVSGSITYIDV